MFKAMHKVLPLRQGALVALMLVITGCGFQLRGTQEVSSDLQQLAVSGEREILVQLRPLLQSSGIEMNDSAAYHLEVLSYQQQRHVAAYNGASAAQYRVEGQLNWQLSTGDKLVLVGPESLKAERLYSFSDNTVTSALSEEKMLKQELQRDLNQRLVRRVANISSEQLALREREAREQQAQAESAKANNASAE